MPEDLLKMDSERLRLEFHIQLIELADKFDDADHRTSVAGTDLQDDCRRIRDVVRGELTPQRTS